MKTRQGSFGRELAYVEARYDIERINEAFGAEWSFEVTTRDVMPDTQEVLVLGRLTAGGVVEQAFGGSHITRNRTTGEVLPLADDLKPAATDALEKAASLFGVGLHLYGDDGEGAALPTPKGNGRNEYPNRQPASQHPQDAHHAEPEGPPADANGNGSGNGSGGARLTSRQLAAAWAIARQNDIPQREVRRLCVTNYNRQPEFLSRGEASLLIDRRKNFLPPQGQR